MKKLIPILTLTALLCPLMPAQERDRDARPAPRDGEKPKSEQIDWDSLKKRIEGAVERGDMTRDEANQKYAEIKKKNAPRERITRPGQDRPMVRRGRPTDLSEIVSDLVSQKKITSENARRILQAASINRPSPQFRPQPPRDQQMAAELREVLNAARAELAQLREARERLLEHHRDQPRPEARDHERRENAGREQEGHRQEIQRERARLELERERSMAQIEIEKLAMEQQKREQQMRLEAEHRMREIAEQSRKLEERRRELEKQKKEDQ